jgi:nicotinate-nucleotide adenylyltransferase
MARTVAVFGGSFNPPHVGHVLAVTYVLSVFPVDDVLVVPVYQHVFGKDLAGFDDRLAMCQRAMGWIPHVEVTDIERRLGGASRTLNTLEALLEEEPDRDLRLIIGSDVLDDLPKWYRFDRIRELAPPIILGRAGYPHPDAPLAVLPEASSTAIRRSFHDDREADIGHLVPRAVRAYVRERGLYRDAAAPEPVETSE